MQEVFVKWSFGNSLRRPACAGSCWIAWAYWAAVDLVWSAAGGFLFPYLGCGLGRGSVSWYAEYFCIGVILGVFGVGHLQKEYLFGRSLLRGG